jgi:hypothetical protein
MDFFLLRGGGGKIVYTKFPFSVPSPRAIYCVTDRRFWNNIILVMIKEENGLVNFLFKTYFTQKTQAPHPGPLDERPQLYYNYTPSSRRSCQQTGRFKVTELLQTLYLAALRQQYNVTSFATVQVLSCLLSPWLCCLCCSGVQFCCDSEACNLVIATIVLIREIGWCQNLNDTVSICWYFLIHALSTNCHRQKKEALLR